MGLLTRAKETWAAVLGQPSSGNMIARIVQTWQAARPLEPTQDRRRLAEWGYRRQSIVYACIVEIATSAAEPELKVGKRQADNTIKDVEANHPLAVLLRNPNPDQSQYELVEQMLTHLNVAGDMYLHKARAPRGNPVQLWTLRPDRTKIKVDLSGMVESYEYSIDGMRKQYPPAADVIHVRLPDPLDDFYGMSPLVPMQRYGQLDIDAAEFMRAFFNNGGSPSGFLKFRQKMIKEERERVREMWRDQYGGKDGWHGVAVLDADVDYTTLGGQAERLRLNFIFDATETRICMAFGVPPIVVGAAIGLQRATFANYREARKSFWEETLAPLYVRLGNALTRGFRADFGDDIVVYFDTTHVSALEEDQAARRTFALEAYGGELMTKNEAREFAGLEPTKDPSGDEFKQAAAAPGAFGDPFAGILGTQNGNGNGQQHGHSPEILGALERGDVASAITKLEGAVSQALKEAPPTQPVSLTVRTMPDPGLERLAVALEGLGKQEPPVVHVHPPAPGAVRKTVTRDSEHRILDVLEEPVVS